MKQASHFIEVNKYDDHIWSGSPLPIHLLQWALGVSKRVDVETIAVFKIYRKPKPAIAHYDYDLQTTIIQ